MRVEYTIEDLAMALGLAISQIVTREEAAKYLGMKSGSYLRTRKGAGSKPGFYKLIFEDGRPVDQAPTYYRSDWLDAWIGRTARLKEVRLGYQEWKPVDHAPDLSVYDIVRITDVWCWGSLALYAPLVWAGSAERKVISMQISREDALLAEAQGPHAVVISPELEEIISKIIQEMDLPSGAKRNGEAVYFWARSALFDRNKLLKTMIRRSQQWTPA